MPKSKNKKNSNSHLVNKKSIEYVDVSVRVSPELKLALKRESLRRGVSQAAIAREAVEQYLKSA